MLRFAIATLAVLAPLVWAACSSGDDAASSEETTSVDAAADGDTPTSDGDVADAFDAAAGDGILSRSASSVFEAETHLVAGSDGTFLAVWMALGGKPPVQNGWAISHDRGKTWSPPVVTSDRSLGDPVATRGADGSFYYGFLDGTCGASGCTNGHVWVTRMAPGAASFGPPVDVSPASPTEFYDKPWMMTAADGTLLVTFNAREGDYPNNVDSIVVARSSDGIGWTRTYAVPKQPKGVLAGIPHACISPTGSRVWVAYVDTSSPIGASIRWSDDVGVTWPDANVGSAFAPTTEAAMIQTYDLRCTGRGDDVWVMYGLSSGPSTAEGLTPLDEIHVAHSSDAGKTWATRAVLKETGMLYLRPEIVLEPGGALDVLAYTGARDGDTNGAIRAWRSTDSGASFQPLATLRTPATFTGDRSGKLWIGDYSGIAFDQGELLGTVADTASGAAHIAFVRAKVP